METTKITLSRLRNTKIDGETKLTELAIKITESDSNSAIDYETLEDEFRLRSDALRRIRSVIHEIEDRELDN